MVKFNEVIQDSLAAQEINLNNLNESLRSSLSAALNSSSKPLQGDDQSQSSQVDRSQAAIMLAEESPEYICPLCDLAADTEVIFCELCLSWTHRTCENLDLPTFNDLSSSTAPYTCKLCTSAQSDLPVSQQIPIPSSVSSTVAVIAGANDIHVPTSNSGPTTSVITSTRTISPQTSVPTTLPCVTTQSMIVASNQPSLRVTTSGTNSTVYTVISSTPITVVSTTRTNSTTTSSSKGTNSRSTPQNNKEPQDKNFKAWEKLKKREISIKDSERQSAAQQVRIVEMEARLKDMDQSNRLLRMQIPRSQAAQSSTSVGNHVYGPPTAPLESTLHSQTDMLRRMELDNLKMRIDSMSQAMLQQQQSAMLFQQHQLFAHQQLQQQLSFQHAYHPWIQPAAPYMMPLVHPMHQAQAHHGMSSHLPSHMAHPGMVHRIPHHANRHTQMHHRRPQQNHQNQQRYPDRLNRINPNDMGSHQHQDSVPLTPTPCQDQQLYVDIPPENVSNDMGSHQHQDSVPLTPTPCQDQQLYVDLPPENVPTECETTSTQDQPLSVDLPSKNVETSPIQRKHSTKRSDRHTDLHS